MNRTICIGLMALPIYLSNAELGNVYSNVSIVKNQLSNIAALMVYSTNAPSGILPWDISARDDQTEDCLRSGICKD
ncbi:MULTISPECIES: hypothetical protein [Nostoc]|uniref:Uncharacterized protein n=1 Tax=Nostoc paludosum FACHB-159 TaxID=2692908 RepID=A0ABR8K7G3_9NOSO|nr:MULTISPECIES: hypothetical protein [Nostoc]MBD2678710.1 hypothetical protein [Nostoc sp. FACHB-857]MBD2734759.1 hypothetical protein [Nostoc paludosum FACHB-159]